MFRGANNDNATAHLTLDNFDLAFGVTFYDGLSHIYEKTNLNKFVKLEYTYMNFGFAVNNEGIKVPTREFKTIQYE